MQNGSHLSHLHFLVAEADTAERLATVVMLGHLGAARITQVADGPGALRCFQPAFTPRVDVAIIDLALPGIDGLALIHELAAMKSRARLIITGAQSASLMFSIETMALAYGLDLLGAIGKPLGMAHLQALLEHDLAPPAAAPQAPEPRLTFEQIGAGLDARQFEPFFQPKIELATGQVTGLEAFARWRHPQLGVLGPGAFMEALRHHERMDFLDWSMIEKSVERCRFFHDHGLAVSISINLAPVTLADPAFITRIGECLRRHGVLADYVTFEMPESSVLTSDPGFIERLVRLRMLGFGLAIDDYGTGHSNLQLLARVPFTELKIDPGFVDGASKKRALSVVLQACLSLAKSLERASVAVGVETRQDWDFLQNLGCTYAQGYHIAKPMEAEAFPGWLEDWRLFF